MKVVETVVSPKYLQSDRKQVTPLVLALFQIFVKSDDNHNCVFHSKWFVSNNKEFVCTSLSLLNDNPI